MSIDFWPQTRATSTQSQNWVEHRHNHPCPAILAIRRLLHSCLRAEGDPNSIMLMGRVARTPAGNIAPNRSWRFHSRLKSDDTNCAAWTRVDVDVDRNLDLDTGTSIGERMWRRRVPRMEWEEMDLQGDLEGRKIEIAIAGIFIHVRH